MDLHLEEDSTDTEAPKAVEGNNPHHQLSLCSLLDLPYRFELDLRLRFVDSLPALDIDGYVTLDARLAWKPIKNLELSVVGQNLLDNHPPEFGSDTFISTLPTEFKRGVYGKITWRF